MSVSYWNRTQPRGRELRADACVIGAGIAGLAAADELGRLGASVVVIERHTPGWGASTRNAGYLMRGTAESYAVAADQLGRDRARAVWTDSEANLRLLIERYAADSLPSFHRRPSVLVAMSEHERGALTRSADMLRDDGFDAALLTNGRDTLWTVLRPTLALENPRDAALSPAELIDAMLRRVTRHPRVTLLTATEVFAIDPDDSPVTIEAAGVTVRAEHALVCTNAYAGTLIPALRGRVIPNRGQMLALRAPGVRLDASYYLDAGSEYLRQAQDGTVILGGMRKRFEAQERTDSDDTTAELQAELERYAERTLGLRGAVVARWAGTMGFTADGLPITEPIDPAGRVWFCGGFTGHGMSLGVVTAHRAVAAMLGR
jgi:glycine/D-amino acid oxidase-like deaminating enzyme